MSAAPATHSIAPRLHSFDERGSRNPRDRAGHDDPLPNCPGNGILCSVLRVGRIGADRRNGEPGRPASTTVAPFERVCPMT